MLSRAVRRRSTSPLSLLALALAASACGGGGDGSTGPGDNGSTTTPPAAATVSATTGLVFSPSSVTIRPGGKVTFAFQSVPHNVTFSAATGAPANIENTENASVDRSFGTAGTFAYRCTLHTGMTGSVVVAATSSNAGGQDCGSYGGC